MVNQSNFQVLLRDGAVKKVAPPATIALYYCEGDEVMPAITCKSCGVAWADEIETMTCPCLDGGY